MRRNKIKIWIGVFGLFLITSSRSWAQDPGWPRQITKPQGALVYDQPQVDNWNNFQELAGVAVDGKY